MKWGQNKTNTITLILKFLKHRVARMNLLDSKLNAWLLLMHLIWHNFYLPLKTEKVGEVSNYSLV